MKPAIKRLLFGGPGAGSKTGDFGLAILRVGVGLLIGIGHGLGKIWLNGHFGVSDQFIANVAKMGFPAPTLFAWCSALAEFLGGVLLAAGLLTRPAAAFMAFNMCVAAFVAHRERPHRCHRRCFQRVRFAVPAPGAVFHVHRRRPTLR